MFYHRYCILLPCSIQVTVAMFFDKHKIQYDMHISYPTFYSVQVRLILLQLIQGRRFKVTNMIKKLCKITFQGLKLLKRLILSVSHFCRSYFIEHVYCLQMIFIYNIIQGNKQNYTMSLKLSFVNK